MSYILHFTREGIKVIDGGDLVNPQNGAVLLELAKNGADNAAPVLGGAADVNLFAELVADAAKANVSAYTRDSFAAVLGTLAAILTLPMGPAVALAADQAFSEAFKEAYDGAHDWSSGHDWSPFFDVLDEVFTTNIDPLATAGINGNANSCFIAARNQLTRRDPLVLDLDGDGLELAGASGAVLFDHNNDGIKTGTGWARPDDGFLVRDLNGNGAIDSGRELFGVDTVKSDNTLASQGFDALSDLDSNGDGQITSADAAFAELKVWQDSNQDGISQSAELKTLAQLNITRIGLNGSSTGPQAGQTINNNLVALSTTFTQNGQTRTVGAIDLEANPFFAEFPPEVVDEVGNPVAITPQAQGLPQMNGSGMVRNMRAAASLDSDFADALQTFAATTTRDGQRSQLDDLITKWAATADFGGGLLSVGFNANITYTMPVGTLAEFVPVTVAEYKHYINVLEAFNGSRFYGNAEGGPRPGGFAIVAATDPVNSNVVYNYIVSPFEDQVINLRKAYIALQESVYEALVVQTRLAPYLDSIELVIDTDGVSIDAAPALALLEAKKLTDERNAFLDLVDLSRFASPTLLLGGVNGLTVLDTWVQGLPSNSPLRAEFAFLDLYLSNTAQGSFRDDLYLGDAAANQFNGGDGDDVIRGGAGADNLYGGAGNDIIDGSDGNDFQRGEGGDDTLFGGAGNDTMYGDAGDDTLEGGAGNDTMHSGTGNNTYVFGLGDGQDTIVYNEDASATKINKVQFKAGIVASDVFVRQVDGPNGIKALELSILGTTDKITIHQFFWGDSTGIVGNIYNPVQQVVFDDGTVWDAAVLTAMVFAGSVGNDVIRGLLGADTISGSVGNDTIDGAAGNDSLHGGDGLDNMRGGVGDDTLYGDGGNDTLYGDAGDDTLEGGAGNDTMHSGTGNNTYVFGLGDGQDTIVYNEDATATKVNKVQFKAGIAVSAVQVRQVDGPGGVKALELSILGTADKITIHHFFWGDSIGIVGNIYNPVQQVVFDDGTVWDAAALTAMAFAGSAGNDVIRGLLGADTIMGGAGDDNIHGAAGHDLLLGGDGNDTMDGGDGNDVVNGGDGNDGIWGNTGDDSLLGGAGNDSMHGGAGNDILEGGAGNDTMSGGAGNNTFVFGLGDGQDTILNGEDPTANKLNKLQFKAGIATSDVRVRQVDGPGGKALELSIAGTTDKITINHFFWGDSTGVVGNIYNPIQQVVFHDGTIWDAAALTAMVFAGSAGNDNIRGLLGNDIISGSAGDDTIDAAAGNDVVNGGDGNDGIWGNTGDDVIKGGAGNDSMYGGAGNDTLEGGVGNDTMGGNSGNNTFIFGLGDGQDTILTGEDPTANKLNKLQFKAGIASSDVRARQVDGPGGKALELSIVGTTDKVTINHFFWGDSTGVVGNIYSPIQQVVFNDGTVWDAAALTAMVFAGSAGNDNIRGLLGADVISSGAGDDTIDAAAGNDVVNGGDGNDGIWGSAGDDTLFGGAGNDSMHGGAGNDTLEGGTGNDTTGGNSGNNTFVFGLGDGQDTILTGEDPTANKLNKLQFKAGIASSDVRARQVDGPGGKALELSIVGTTDKVTINHFFWGDSTGGASNIYNPIQQVVFDDGTVWDVAALTAMVFAGSAGNDIVRGLVSADTIIGGAGDDNLNGAAGSDLLDGGDGNDFLRGETGDDTLLGGAGNDSLYADGGIDTLDGGSGTDVLVGGAGNDTYFLARGHESDTIQEVDATAGNLDVALFDSDIAADQLWFRQVGSNLEVSVIGTSDKFTVSNWYSGSQYRVEKFQAGDDAILLDSQVQNLVQAMAGFSPPAAGETTLPANYASSLDSVIVANWQ